MYQKGSKGLLGASQRIWKKSRKKEPENQEPRGVLTPESLKGEIVVLSD